MARTTQNVCLTLPPETLRKVDRAAQHDGRSRSQYVNRVLERAVHEVTGATRLADLEAIAAAGLSNQENEMTDPLKDRKEGTPLEKDLPHNPGRGVHDIYSPQRAKDPSTPTGYASEPLPSSKEGIVPRTPFSSTPRRSEK
jgi:hypothetical protein